MRKTYSVNEFLEVAKKRIFSDLLNIAPQVNIFEVIKLWSGDYLPVSQMKSGSFWVYWGGWKTNQTHLESNVSGVTIWIGRVGARCGCVFKIAWPAWVTDNALYASHISKDYDLDFLMHYLNFTNLNQYANTAAQPVIGLKRISNVTIPKIDIAKQKEIADLLFRISNWSYSLEEDDNFNLKKVISVQQNFSDISENLELCHKYIWNLRSAILREAVQGKLILQDPNEWNARDLLDQIQKEREQSTNGKKSKKSEIKTIDPSEIPFEIPENWAWCRMESVCTISTWKKDVNEWSTDGIYPFFTCAQEPLKSNSYSFDDDCILLPGNWANLWVVMRYTWKFELYQRTYCLHQISGVFDVNYMEIFLQAYWKKNIGTQYGSGINYIRINNLTDFLVNIPPISEQKRIVIKANDLLKKLAELETSITESKNLSERLLKVGLKEVFNS